jgi:hypothetical protein
MKRKQPKKQISRVTLVLDCDNRQLLKQLAETTLALQWVAKKLRDCSLIFRSALVPNVHKRGTSTGKTPQRKRK